MFCVIFLYCLPSEAKGLILFNSLIFAGLRPLLDMIGSFQHQFPVLDADWLEERFNEIPLCRFKLQGETPPQMSKIELISISETYG